MDAVLVLEFCCCVGQLMAGDLATYGVDHTGLHWWDSCPPCASVAFTHNLQGLPNFRYG